MSKLYELPDGWEWNTINDVCEKITDGAHKSPKTIDEGKPYITVRDVDSKGNIDFINCKKISKEDYALLVKGNCKPLEGDVLFSKDGTVGKVSLINYEKDFVVLSSLAILRPSLKIESEYLTKYLQSPFFYDKAIKSKTGAAIKRVVLRTIKNLDIPLPPLQEQKRIVAKLDTLFEKIDKAIVLHQKNMDEADVFMGSVLNEVFRELDIDKKTSLKSITTKIGSGSTPRGGQKAYKTEGISLIRSMNVHDSGFRVKGLAFIDEEQAKKLDNVTIQENDILLNITGASVARCCIVDEEYLPARVNQHVSIIRLKEEVIPSFLHYYLISPSIKSDLLFSSSGGATREAITKSMLEDFKVPIVSMEKQKKVVQYIDQISEKTEKLKQVQKKKMESLKALKASILDRAFRGEL